MTSASQAPREFLDTKWPEGVIVVAQSGGEDAAKTHSLVPETASQISPEFWRTLNEALAHLGAYEGGEGVSTWIFETALLFVAQRANGDWAGVMTLREIPGSTKTFVAARLGEFAGAQAELT
jgi:hypothetical protein